MLNIVKADFNKMKHLEPISGSGCFNAELC